MDEYITVSTHLIGVSRRALLAQRIAEIHGIRRTPVHTHHASHTNHSAQRQVRGHDVWRIGRVKQTLTR